MILESRDLRVAAGSELASRLSTRYLQEHKLIPLNIDQEGNLLVAASEQPHETVVDELARLFGTEVTIVPVPESELVAALMSIRQFAQAESVSPEVVARPRADDIEVGDLEALANEAPVVKLVNVLLADALRMHVSDVHLESVPEGLRVRYRVDGVLHDVSRVAQSHRAAVVSRIKILAGLDIAERRLPQDGRTRIVVADREIDVRVSTLPALHGESIVLRILDHGGSARGLEDLGMPADVRRRFSSLLAQTSGMIVVTGPTGSGKTTTLYAAIERVNSAGVKIVTIEEPIEYQIPGVIQIPVNPGVHFDFSDALRSILRHDPDIIMVGEMRDRETAEIAIQAALTGHLVFSTLHTSEAAGAVTRLADMGIEPFRIAAAIRGVVAQRLVRVLCESCAEGYVPSTTELAAAPESVKARTTFRRAIGCERCNGSGYAGRTGVYELFVLADSHQALIANGASISDLRAAARRSGAASLDESAWNLAADGVTSIEELRRALGTSHS
jgi:general secretion pathway protein E